MATAVAARARRRRALGSDYQWDEVVVAVLVALSMPVWVTVVFAIDSLDNHAAAPLITAGDAIPIRVTPVVDMDSPLLKLGGKKKLKAKLPDMWKPKVAPRPTQIVKQRAHVSTKAEDTTDAIPSKDLEVSDAGTAPPPDAAVAKDVDVEIPDVVDDAGTEAEGGGSPAGSPDGTETDPLKARASSLYHGRILRFLKSGFSCPAAAAAGCMPSASVSIGSGGTVTAFSFRPCGDAAIDGAAKAAIASKVGQSIPPPPDSYPELIPNHFGVTYVCK